MYKVLKITHVYIFNNYTFTIFLVITHADIFNNYISRIFTYTFENF